MYLNSELIFVSFGSLCILNSHTESGITKCYSVHVCVKGYLCWPWRPLVTPVVSRVTPVAVINVTCITPVIVLKPLPSIDAFTSSKICLAKNEVAHYNLNISSKASSIIVCMYGYLVAKNDHNACCRFKKPAAWAQ